MSLSLLFDVDVSADCVVTAAPMTSGAEFCGSAIVNLTVVDVFRFIVPSAHSRFVPSSKQRLS